MDCWTRQEFVGKPTRGGRNHHRRTADTVPVRSSIAGGKVRECSRPTRPSDVLRAGTARAPMTRCVC